MPQTMPLAGKAVLPGRMNVAASSAAGGGNVRRHGDYGWYGRQGLA